MLVAAAVCPCPPLLVPEVASGAAAELDGMRQACRQAVGSLAAARPDRLVVVGPVAGSGRTAYGDGAHGSFRGYGVDLDVCLGAPGGRSEAAAAASALPPSLCVAAWLLADAGWPPEVPVAGHAVGERTAAGQCRETGHGLARGPARVALLAMGDASACRSLQAPGYFHERAEGFDAAAARALATADVAALGALDAELAHAVQAAGRAAWQVLGGAAADTGLSGELLYDDAPYGVGYLVAAWS